MYVLEGDANENEQDLMRDFGVDAAWPRLQEETRRDHNATA